MKTEIESVIALDYMCFYCLVDGFKCSCAEISLLSDGNWYFNRLFVNKDFRGHGIAGRLLCELLTYVKEKNLKLICEVNSYGDMCCEELKALYVNYGFEDMGEYLKFE